MDNEVEMSVEELKLMMDSVESLIGFKTLLLRQRAYRKSLDLWLRDKKNTNDTMEVISRFKRELAEFCEKHRLNSKEVSRVLYCYSKHTGERRF
jgi:dsRNA-specific ribonuclease